MPKKMVPVSQGKGGKNRKKNTKSSNPNVFRGRNDHTARNGDIDNSADNDDSFTPPEEPPQKKQLKDYPNPLSYLTDTLRRKYLENFKDLAIKLGAFTVGIIVVSVLFDIFVPFSVWGNVARALLVLVEATLFFSIGYLISFFMLLGNRATNPDYVPLKERYSPSWRLRISAITAAALFFIILSTSHSAVYSLVSSVVVACIMGLIIFISKTPEEEEREFYGIPDKRDNAYYNALHDIQDKKERRKQAKKERK